MRTTARVLADSVSPDGVRLMTFMVRFPRFILAELNTHRALSRNSASSRAIPPEQLIAQVAHDPFIPVTFNERVKGMGAGEKLDPEKQAIARSAWRVAAEDAVRHARVLNSIGIDKSRINRVLEPFLWHTAILSATDWANFFALRCPPDQPDPKFAAQLEFQVLATRMRDAAIKSKPREVGFGEWHLPCLSEEDAEHIDIPLRAAYVSAGICARVSYDKATEAETHDESYRRAVRLGAAGHLSPFEHPARPLEPAEGARFDTGNFRGWVQLRKLFDHEDDYSQLRKCDEWGREPWLE